MDGSERRADESSAVSRGSSAVFCYPAAQIYHRSSPLIRGLAGALGLALLAGWAAGLQAGVLDPCYASAFWLAGLIPVAFVFLRRGARDEQRTGAHRRPAERQANSGEDRFQSLFDCSPVGLFLHDPAGLCTSTNSRWTQISGLTREQSLGEGWLQAIHPDDRDRVAQQWKAAMATGLEFVGEFRFLSLDAGVRRVRASAAPLPATAGWVGTIVDVSERWASEQRRADLVSMLSHDLRNSLTVITGFTEHLLDTSITAEPDRGILQRIEVNAKIAITLASNFVDAMRIEAGKLEVRRQRQPLSETVHAVLESETTLANARGVTIEAIVSGEIPDLFVDGRLLERALGNLVSNAVKFSPPGGRVQVISEAGPGEARIAVSDEGPGIDPVDQPKLFQHFRALGDGKPGSIGLGLFIVKTIAEAHGGSVGFSSPPCGGSTFTIALPIDH